MNLQILVSHWGGVGTRYSFAPGKNDMENRGIHKLLNEESDAIEYLRIQVTC